MAPFADLSPAGPCSRAVAIASPRRFAGKLLALAALCATLVLAGCASTPVGPQLARSPTTVPTSEAMVFPPPGGPGLLTIVETRYENAVSQTITLQTDSRTAGENAITITRFSGAGGTGDFGELADVELANVDLLGEAQVAWPQAQMQISPYFAQNTYGPFGYAIGQAPTGDVCIYAWQRIEPRLRPGGGVERGSVSIRLRACDRAANEQRLVGMMYTMRLRDPVYDNLRASPLIGAPGVPILPTGLGGFAEVLQEPTTPPPTVVQAAPVQATPAVVTVPTVSPTPQLPAPTGPTVPLPGGQMPAASPGGNQSDPTISGNGPTVPLPPEA